jgi:hypothetical protein
MNEKSANVDPLLMQLILSFHAGAMQQMGKIASPLTGKVERNIEAARMSIDTVAMLEKKMAGNLTEEEAKLISHTLYELRMNFVDESNKPDEPTAEESGQEPSGDVEVGDDPVATSDTSVSEGDEKEGQS